MNKTNHESSDSYEYADEIFIMNTYCNDYNHAYHVATYRDRVAACFLAEVF